MQPQTSTFSPSETLSSAAKQRTTTGTFTSQRHRSREVALQILYKIDLISQPAPTPTQVQPENSVAPASTISGQVLRASTYATGTPESASAPERTSETIATTASGTPLVRRRRAPTVVEGESPVVNSSATPLTTGGFTTGSFGNFQGMRSENGTRAEVVTPLTQFAVGTRSAHPPVLAFVQPKRSSAQLISEIAKHLEHFEVAPSIREFAAELVAGTILEISQVDQLLEKHAAHWKINRMTLVDRNLLRLAAYELLHFGETPASVIINEAVELAKQFGTAETPAFVNGILDSIRTGVRPQNHQEVRQ
jgi:N utilization substance protein B